MKRFWKLLKLILPIVILFAVLLFVKINVGQAAYIPSGSMIPTLQIHDVLIIDKLIKPEKLKFGEIIVFYPPAEAKIDKILIKRLIGLSGDTIEIRDGMLIRNGKPVDEPYIKERMQYTFGPIKVPAGKFFFLGDNRNLSLDAHLWPNPFVEGKSLIGKAVFRIYPFNHIQGI